MEQVASKVPSRSLLGIVLRVWREEGWPGLVWRLRMRLGWLGLHPPATRLPPLRRPDWLTIGASGECFAREIGLPPATEPLVSVLLHDPGRVEDILCLLATIARHRPEASLEVIVVDDASNDDSPRLLPLVENLVYVRNEASEGFARCMNRAARAARGRYLLFIDEGAQVQRGWLDELVAAFDDPRVGMAGSKAISRSGRLEEAWSVLRSDGLERIGLDEDPRIPEYNSTRRVDYCSRASVMVPREQFLEQDGFDEAVTPSHVEDLSLRVRSRGLSVLYAPGSVVVHDPGNGPGPGTKRPRLEVSPALRERWSGAIAREERVRAIAFYLPQYHPIPENDSWWGKGFTEWTNVARAKPLYRGHVQPRIPADLGFYDLRLPEAREAQAALAAAHGLSGFCFYYYWFHGRRLLDRPLADTLEQKRPAFPFCVCWANENWTRRWDGHEAEILIGQEHSPEDDRRFIESLLPFFEDERYIRIDGRPLLLLYRARLLPDLEQTAGIWRRAARTAGLGDLYLAAVQSFDTGQVDPRTWGFDAAVEFPPHGFAVAAKRPRGAHSEGQFFDYPKSASSFSARPLPSYPLFRTAMPSWDNSPRRKERAHIFVNDSAEAYERWLRAIVRQTRRFKSGDERIVFINAWNEWAEGNYLEPDLDRGRSYLEATARALGCSDD
jgi:glycosyltransferase involved in cell wall biosynthesis